MHTFLILILALAAVAAVPDNPQRIVGGTATTIANYPSIASLQYSATLSYWSQACGGIILTTRSILTAAHCINGHPVIRWRGRVGSTFGSSGGTVHNFMSYVIHPQYNVGALFNNDIAIMHTNTVIVYVNNAVRPASIAGPNYNVADNQVVWAAGWGATFNNGPTVETLRHVPIFTINQNTCVNRYRELNKVVTDNMLCSGVLDVGGRCQCQGDSGGPLYHHNVVVGVCSWSEECGLARYPGVNVRVSRYTSWIQQWAW